jgi:hypothetical protein
MPLLLIQCDGELHVAALAGFESYTPERTVAKLPCDVAKKVEIK